MVGWWSRPYSKRKIRPFSHYTVFSSRKVCYKRTENEGYVALMKPPVIHQEIAMVFEFSNASIRKFVEALLSAGYLSVIWPDNEQFLHMLKNSE